MIDAPTWTVGPSRPTDAPVASASKVKATLPTAMRSDSSRSRALPVGSDSVAMVWGIPLPCAPANTFFVSQAPSARPAGAAK